MTYHREVFWSSNFDRQINNILDSNTKFVFSYHLRNRYDEKHHIDYRKLNDIIHSVKHKHNKAFECECEYNRVEKFVIRTKYDKNRDVSIVFLDMGDHILIKTVWLNNKYDLHKTLKGGNYARN